VTGFKLKSADDAGDKSFSDVYEMLFSYVKQETLKPIRGAGRWIAFGFTAALFLSIGIVLGSLGVLRLVQTSSLGDSAAWSWLSYVVALLLLVVVFVISVSRIRKGTLNKS